MAGVCVCVLYTTGMCERLSGVCVISVCVFSCVCNCVRNLGRKSYPQPTHRHPRNITYMPTPPNPTSHTLHQNTQPPLPTPHNNTTLLVHRAPQLIADPAPNLLLGHHITQSHVQSRQGVHVAQTRRNCAAELIGAEGPDATARGASVVVVWCTAMTHARLGC